jgi:PEGA domain
MMTMTVRVPVPRAALAAAFVLLAGMSAAQAQPAPAADVPEDAAPSEELKEEARRHFEKGLVLKGERAWAAAVAELLLSRKLYPTRNATFHAADCLNELQRYEEALEMFETLLREFPKLPTEQKDEAQAAIDRLRGLVGTLEITGAKPGASIVIDGRDRGDYPPVNPIRVAAGTHTVRILKEGYTPFETSVDVAGGRTAQVGAKLLMLTESGRLKVSEQSGKALDVLLDGDIVGRTPWEGMLSVGDHVVVLRSEGNLGTGPASAPIKARELTTLSLRAEELGAMLRVDPTPAGALVIVDGVAVGRGTWEGALRIGDHRIEVRDGGFVTAAKQLRLARGQQEQVAIALQRDEDAEVWRKPPKVTFDISSGFALVPSFGGDVAGACDGACDRSVGLGALGLLHAGYELGSGIGLGATLGYVIAYQEVTGRETAIRPVQLGDAAGTIGSAQGIAKDHLRFSGLIAGGTVGYHTGERLPFPALIRLGGGVALGAVRAQRWFVPDAGTSNPDAVIEVAPTEDSPFAAYFYVDPEVRLGVRVGERIELSAGVHAFILVALSAPRFDDQQEIGVLHRSIADRAMPATSLRRPGLGSYPADALTGDAVVLIVPSLGARYAF